MYYHNREFLCSKCWLQVNQNTESNVVCMCIFDVKRGGLKIAESFSCADLKSVRDDQLKGVLVRDHGVIPFGSVRVYPATSCKQVKNAHHELQSGEYWIFSHGEEPGKILREF